MRLAYRVLLAVGLLGGMVAGGFGHFGGNALATLSGDANCSGHVDVLDAQAVLQFTADYIIVLLCPENSDVNHNGRINTADAAWIWREWAL